MQQDFNMSENLVIIHTSAMDRFEIIKNLSTLLYEHGYVKESYITAIQNREKIYPTGLATATVGIAIPHTDAEHVISPAIAVATLKNPVSFAMMGNPEEKVSVTIVFMLAIKEPTSQIDMLQNLSQMFQKADVLDKIRGLRDSQELLAEVRKELHC